MFILQAFANCESKNYSYKLSLRIMFLAMFDSNYNFKIVDIDTAGRCSAGGVFSNFEMGKCFMYLKLPCKKKKNW